MRIECEQCKQRVHYYNPRVGRHRQTRYCEHVDQKTGKPCPASRQPVNSRQK